MAEDAHDTLRVGLMLDSLDVEAWVEDVVRRIDELGFAEVTLVLLNATPPPRGNKYVRLRRWLLYYAYEKLDRRLFARRDPFRLVDLRPRLDHAVVMAVTPETRGYVQRFDPETIAAIRSHDLDVIVRFGFRIIRGEILDCARYGIWSHHHGDNRTFRGGPPSFWEMASREPTTGAILQVLSDAIDAGKIIYRSATTTDFVSLQRSRERNFWKSTAFVPRRLADVHRGGAAALESIASAREAPTTDAPIYRLPTNAAMVRFLARLVPRVLAASARRFRPIHWFVGYRTRGDDGRWRVIEPPRDRFYADPFLYEHDGSAYVFFEDYAYASGSGIVSYVRIADGSHSEPRPALVRDTHLSYPLVFSNAGTIYMLPETLETGRVELFRATRFPDTWELHAVLLDRPAADPTLFVHDGRFWLFVNVAEPGAAHEDELSLYFADALEGPWQPHPQNPVVSGVRGARGAGRVFERDGMLIRPGQDVANVGVGVLLHAIDCLTPDAYEERVIDRLGGDWHPRARGSHTYNESEHWVVTDGYRLPVKLAWKRRVR